MKKHIIGLALFSFIVSIAAVIYAVFNVPQVVAVYEVVSTPQYVPSEKTHCKMKRQSNTGSIEITQAIINLQTKEFDWEIIAPDTDAPIKLHFFSKDNNGTRYLISSPPVGFARTGRLKINKAFKFLYDRESYENLYVIGEFYSESKVYDESNPPKFDLNKATAVTFNYGNGN